jgi:predicted AAA+ superfamily ATPase
VKDDMIIRELESVIKSRIGKGKAIIVLGPRQTGKTTLFRSLSSEMNDFLFLDCDDVLVREYLSAPKTETLKQIIGKHKYIFIDEAQRIKNIGLTLKIITDQIPEVQLFVSGSSAFELSNELNEPLTGRKWEYLLLPISWNEYEDHTGFLKSEQLLETRLIYGMYPDVINHPGDEKEVLNQLSDSYLYKDLLAFKGIRKPEILEKLLRALSLQICNEVSYNELSSLIGIDKNTISSYIDLLEKAFVIFRLHPFARNIRNEISTNRKIYFYDNGIRNAVIANYNLLSLRQDIGALWENFMISERVKYLNNNRKLSNIYFWRTTQKQEIDYIEESDGNITAYEFKWNPKAKSKFSKTFTNNYTAETKVINRKNFREFLID